MQLEPACRQTSWRPFWIDSKCGYLMRIFPICTQKKSIPGYLFKPRDVRPKRSQCLINQSSSPIVCQEYARQWPIPSVICTNFWILCIFGPFIDKAGQIWKYHFNSMVITSFQHSRTLILMESLFSCNDDYLFQDRTDIHGNGKFYSRTTSISLETYTMDINILICAFIL